MIVLGGILGLVILLTIALPVLARRRPDLELAGLRARVRAWWVMIAIFLTANLVEPSLSLVGFALLSGMALREFLNRIDDLPRSVRLWCYAVIPLQYYWVFIGWYGMFIIFIPVYAFLYLPTRLPPPHGVRQAAFIHWGLMATTFCLSHAAFLLVLKVGPAGGAGLLLFLVLLTELGDAVRLLVSRPEINLPLAVIATAGGALLLGPVLTPLSQTHTLVAGLVLALAGAIGGDRLSQLRVDLGLGEGPLPPGQGGALARIVGLTYTAPLLLHGIRYFYT